MLNTTITLSEPSNTGPSGTENHTKELVDASHAVPFQAIMAQMQNPEQIGVTAIQASGGSITANPSGSAEPAQRQESAASSLGLVPGLGTFQDPVGMGVFLSTPRPTVAADASDPAGQTPTVPVAGMTLSTAALQLKQLPLGQQMTLITSDQPSPSEASLSRFAQQQGLDAHTIRWLLSGSPPSASEIANFALASDAAPGHPHLATGLQAWLGWGQSPSVLGHSNDPLAQDGLAQAIGKTSGTGQPVPLLGVDLDLSQDPSIDWVGWIKAMTSPRQTDESFGAALNAFGRNADASENGAWALALDAAPQDGAEHAPPFPPHSQGLASGQEFKSELLKAQGPDGLLARAAPLSGQELADKMSYAIGKRLLEAIEKGDWQIKINLKPAELGHIEVDLRMRDNALDARFSAQQGLTRDLLEGGLGRLKETLQHSGMDVASLRVNDGQSSRNGGDSTPRHGQSGTQDAKPERDLSSETEVMALSRNRFNADGGLDLMV